MLLAETLSVVWDDFSIGYLLSAFTFCRGFICYLIFGVSKHYKPKSKTNRIVIYVD